jgi:molybdopterin molybdotransferase
LRAGQALRIFTGGEMPAGADTVVMQEFTKREFDTVLVLEKPTAGRHVRKAGLDFKAGDVLLKRGRHLSARDLGSVASMNHALVPVPRKARVAVLATGDELVPPGQEPGPGQIVYSNGYSIMATARQEAAEVIDLGLVPDRIEPTIAAIRRARELQADVLVTTGGASVGEYDLVQKALAAEGLDLSFWRIAMRPGRPLMHGRLGGMHVLGLPGNPVSAYVCAVLFLVPLLRRFAGRADCGHITEQALAGSDLRANDERADYMRARLSRTPRGQLVATPFSLQDSSITRVLSEADCLILREPHAPAAAAGSPCVILKLPF